MCLLEHNNSGQIGAHFARGAWLHSSSSFVAQLLQHGMSFIMAVRLSNSATILTASQVRLAFRVSTGPT